MAVTLESGSYVKFQYNLGTGPIDIINWAVKVRPGYWYTAYATRSVECYLLCAFYGVTSAAIFGVSKQCDFSPVSVGNEFFDYTQKFLKHLFMSRKRVIVLNN